MNETEWKSYYRYMVERGMKPDKERELVSRCGGKSEGESHEQSFKRYREEIYALPVVTQTTKEIRRIVQEELKGK